jgi:cell division protein DivIC
MKKNLAIKSSLIKSSSIKSSSKKQKKSNKTNNKIKVFILVLLIAVFSGGAALQYYGYLRILSMEDGAKEELRIEEIRREQLQERLKYTDGDDFAVEIARERLGMLYENEYKIIVE